MVVTQARSRKYPAFGRGFCSIPPDRARGRRVPEVLKVGWMRSRNDLRGIARLDDSLVVRDDGVAAVALEILDSWNTRMGVSDSEEVVWARRRKEIRGVSVPFSQ